MTDVESVGCGRTQRRNVPGDNVVDRISAMTANP
jgi:hypothetical protein